MAIDIGILGGNTEVGLYNRTHIIKDNPANASGTITLVKIRCSGGGMSGIKIGTFYSTDTNTFKCRDSDTVSNLSGSGTHERPVSIAVQIGDYIGIFHSAGWLLGDTTGGSGLCYIDGDYCNPDDEGSYDQLGTTWYGGLYGEGVEPPTYSFRTDAVIQKTTLDSLTADAYLVNAIFANAVIFKAQQSSVIADAILKKTAADSLAADSVLQKTTVGTLDADGVLRKTVSDSIPADGVLFKTITDAIPGDAYLTYGVFADGVIFKTQTASFSADAIIFPAQHIFMKAGPIYIPVYPLT